MGKDTLVKMQLDDESLNSYRDREDVMAKGEKEVSFEVENGVLYRMWQTIQCK